MSFSSRVLVLKDPCALARTMSFLLTLAIFGTVTQCVFRNFAEFRYWGERGAFIALCLGAFAFLGGLFVYRMWLLAAPKDEPLGPGVAALLLYIPFFNLYWIFVVVLKITSHVRRNDKYGYRDLKVLALVACSSFVIFFVTSWFAFNCGRLQWSYPTALVWLDVFANAAGFAAWTLWLHKISRLTAELIGFPEIPASKIGKSPTFNILRACVASGSLLFANFLLPRLHPQISPVLPYRDPRLADPELQNISERNARSRETFQNMDRASRGELPIWQGPPLDGSDAEFRNKLFHQAMETRKARQDLQALSRAFH